MPYLPLPVRPSVSAPHHPTLNRHRADDPRIGRVSNGVIHMYSPTQFSLRKPLKGVKVCRIPGCKRPLDPGLSMCAAHQRQANRHGIPTCNEGTPKAALRHNLRSITRPYLSAARSWITDETRRTGTKGRYRLNRPRNETLVNALGELNRWMEFRCNETLRLSDLGRPRVKPERKARGIFKSIRKRFGDLGSHAVLAVLIGVQLAVEVEGESQDPRFLRAAQFRALWTLCPTPKGCKRPRLAGRYLHQAVDRLVTSRFVPFILTKQAKEAVLKKAMAAKYGNPKWGVWFLKNINHT